MVNSLPVWPRGSIDHCLSGKVLTWWASGDDIILMWIGLKTPENITKYIRIK